MMHRKLMQDEFGQKTRTFRNTELIYQDRISDLVYEIEGFTSIITEGVDRILQWRSPMYAYKNYSKDINLLLKYYKLSDDIAFRFSNRDWPEFPLTVDKFVNWIDHLTLGEKNDRNLFLNLFMDYETFGEHQWAESGIFEFMKHFPAEVLKRSHLGFVTPSETQALANYQQESLSFPDAGEEVLIGLCCQIVNVYPHLPRQQKDHCIHLHQLFQRILLIISEGYDLLSAHARLGGDQPNSLVKYGLFRRGFKSQGYIHRIDIKRR